MEIKLDDEAFNKLQKKVIEELVIPEKRNHVCRGDHCKMR